MDHSWQIFWFIWCLQQDSWWSIHWIVPTIKACWHGSYLDHRRKPYFPLWSQGISIKIRLGRRTEVVFQQWDLVSQSQSRVTKWDTKSKDKDRMTTLEVNILTWTQQMDELQQKIKAEEKEKDEIGTYGFYKKEVSWRGHNSNWTCQERSCTGKELNKLKIEDAMNDKRIRHAKLPLEKMKTELLSWNSGILYFEFIVSITLPFWNLWMNAIL